MVDESLLLVFQEALANNLPPAAEAPTVEQRLRTLLAYSDAPHGLSPRQVHRAGDPSTG